MIMFEEETFQKILKILISSAARKSGAETNSSFTVSRSFLENAAKHEREINVIFVKWTRERK